MKRTLILALLFVVLGIGAWLAIRANARKDTTRISWDMDFAVQDVSTIHKVFLADKNGNRITLKRNGDQWICNDKYPVRPTAMQHLMETLQNIVVWYVPAKAAEPEMIRSLATHGIKVELFNKDGTRIKGYYVGGVTNDERGTFMMMDGAEQPYVVHLPYFVGQVRVRYMVGEEDWRDRAVFSEKPESIASISVEYPQMKSKSFKVEKMGEAEYAVSPFYSTTPTRKTPPRKGVAEAYILQYESLIAEAFETNNPVRDSVRALVPFAVITVKTTGGKEKQARFWPVEFVFNNMTNDYMVERYYTETSQPSFMLTQQRVFGPVFREYAYFFDKPVGR
ncbi:MAG: DUF4340 domain-containing protein [Saprospiraceae bacterium]|nr:DUF4340 domain-containing protein [Saprospiraceae bacterium]